jgi:hypothetical protein
VHIALALATAAAFFAAAAFATPAPPPIAHVAGSVHIGAFTALAASGSQLWVAQPGVGSRPGALFDLSLTTLDVRRHIAVGSQPACVAVSRNSIWVANTQGDGELRLAEPDTLMSIAPSSARILRIFRFAGLTCVAATQTRVWILRSARREVDRLDPQTGAIAARVVLPHKFQLIQIRASAGTAWVIGTVTSPGGDSQSIIWRLSDRGDSVALVVTSRSTIYGLELVGRRLWLTTPRGVSTFDVPRRKLRLVLALREATGICRLGNAIWISTARGSMIALRENGTALGEVRVSKTADHPAAAGRTLVVADSAAGRLFALAT